MGDRIAQQCNVGQTVAKDFKQQNLLQHNQ